MFLVGWIQIGGAGRRRAGAHGPAGRDDLHAQAAEGLELRGGSRRVGDEMGQPAGVAEADKAGAAELAAVGQERHAAGARDGQFLGEGLVGIGGRQARLGGEADRAHEGPVELDALADRAREGSDEGLAEPAALAAGEDHARPVAAEQLRDA